MEKEIVGGVSLEYLRGKPSDHKVCTGCGAVNYYENPRCYRCGKSDFVGIDPYYATDDGRNVFADPVEVIVPREGELG